MRSLRCIYPCVVRSIQPVSVRHQFITREYIILYSLAKPTIAANKTSFAICPLFIHQFVKKKKLSSGNDALTFLLQIMNTKNCIYLLCVDAFKLPTICDT